MVIARTIVHSLRVDLTRSLWLNVEALGAILFGLRAARVFV